MSFSIRPAVPDDVPVLNPLIQASARALSAGYYSPQQIEAAIRYVFGVDSNLISDRTYLVVEEGSGIGSGPSSSRRNMPAAASVGCCSPPVPPPPAPPASDGSSSWQHCPGFRFMRRWDSGSWNGSPTCSLTYCHRIRPDGAGLQGLIVAATGLAYPARH